MNEIEKKYYASFDRLKTKIADSIAKDIRQVAKLYKASYPEKLSDVSGQLAFLHATFHDVVANSFTTSLQGMASFVDDKTMNDLLGEEWCGKTDNNGGRLDRGLDS